MKEQNSFQRTIRPRRSAHVDRAEIDPQAITLDHEVLAPEPRRPFWEEAGAGWEWECIVRRGNRKPSLDDYDRWPLQAQSPTGDRRPATGDHSRSNHF